MRCSVTAAARTGCFALALCVAACGRPAPAGPALQTGGERPCAGAELDLDRIVQRCTVKARAQPPPPAAALRLVLVPASVRTGEETDLSLTMTNVTDRPMMLDVTLGCAAFEAGARHAGHEERADEEYSEACASMGGLCGSGYPVRVSLKPGGTLHKRVPFAARVRRLEREGKRCVWRPAGALPPGRYVVRVTLPFRDPVPGEPHVVRSRHVEGQVVVLP